MVNIVSTEDNKKVNSYPWLFRQQEDLFQDLGF